jgi:hypothetical protein
LDGGSIDAGPTETPEVVISLSSTAVTCLAAASIMAPARLAGQKE